MKIKFSFYLLFWITVLTDGGAASTRHCHNETGRCFWLGNGAKSWEDARTACQSEVEILPSWKQKSYGILRAVGLQVIATVRKRSYGKVMFLHMSDIPFTWDEVYTP